jgi:hypothetical protein
MAEALLLSHAFVIVSPRFYHLLAPDTHIP